MEIEAFEEYLKKERNYSDHTILAYGNDLKSFVEFIRLETEETDPDQIDYKIIRAWIAFLVNSGISNNSVNRKISSLKAYYDFLLKIQRIKASPLLKHRSLKTAKKVQVPFSEKEMEQIFKLPVPNDFESSRDLLMIELMYLTGIRRAELMGIRLSDINRSDAYLKITGKGNKQRVIPLLETVFDSIDLYMRFRKKLENIEDEDYLLLTTKGKRIYGTLVYRVVERYFKGVSSRHKISPHILRHTFATHLLDQGADINSIKHLLGHESLATTQSYTHNSMAVLKEMYGKAHPRSKNNKK